MAILALAQALGEMVAERADAWQNAFTGLGTARDKTKYHTPTPTAQLSDGELAALFDDDDIAARIVDQLPRDSVRRGFSIKLDKDDDPNATTVSRDIVQAIEGMQGLQKLREAWIWARLYNLSAVFVGADDGMPLWSPLKIERVRSVRFLNVLRRTQLQVDTYYTNVREPKFGEPETFRIVQLPSDNTVGTNGRGNDALLGERIHESRMLVFRGVMSAANLPTMSGEQLPDNSVLQRVKETLQYSSQAWMSASHLMSDASQGVLSIQNLMQMLSTGGETLLRKRMQMMDLARSVCRSILVDADKENFQRVPTSFQGLPDMLDRQMMRVASAARMPVTILFGRSPAGMNATGESDTRAWYDEVSSERAEHLEPRLKQLIELVMATDQGPTKGKLLEGWHIVWPPLWQPTDKEKAETFKLKADALVALSTGQIAQPEEAALKLAHDGDFAELDVESREQALKVVLERVANPPDPNEVSDPNADPNADPSADDPDPEPDDDAQDVAA